MTPVQPSEPEPPAGAQTPIPPKPSKKESVSWVTRAVVGLLLMVCMAGGISLGILAQPVIRAGKGAIVEIPNQIFDLPDPTALPVICAVLGKSKDSIVGELTSPISRSLLDAMVKAARDRKVQVRLTLPFDASASTQILREGGVIVQQVPRVGGNWLALDNQFLILSTTSFNSGATERDAGRILIVRGTLAQTYVARYRQQKL